MEEQADASLTAYNNDDGDFAEAVRARISELNAEVELIQMMAERAKTLASFRYLTTEASNIPSFSMTDLQVTQCLVPRAQSWQEQKCILISLIFLNTTLQQLLCPHGQKIT